MKNVYERQVIEVDKRIFILTRSAFSGQQKFGTTVWSGDIRTDFETLKNQIPAGLNFCMAGFPYWTTDIGGYKGGNPKDPKYQEIFTRWFQYGTFCPVFRTHGRRYPGDRTGANELWSYGEEKQKILAKYVKLRYRLLPYIYSLSHRVSMEGYTMMRSLVFDFMEDPKVHDIKDQFMFGDNFLVCPVTEEGALKRNVYLPKGEQWFNFWTGKIYEGGQIIETDAPIETMPLFIKAGSIIPMGPIIQYSTEKPADPVELRIYSGKDASFTLYEDENDNYNYKSGKYIKIPIQYTDNNKMLKIGPTVGDFPGMLKKRVFNIVLVNENSGVDIDINDKISIIHYLGKEMNIKCK
jgi:alpha-D-xyloside xylohydrolase